MYMQKMSNGNENGRTEASKLPYKIRLLGDFAELYTGAGTEYVMLGSISDDNRLEIAEERWGKGQKLWGRLRSDAGWILLENTEKIDAN